MFDKLFDLYIWKARVLVAILVSLPVLALIPWLAALVQWQASPWLANSLVGAAVVALAALVVRHFGVLAQEELVREWEALPTTLVMRWSDGTRSTAWKERMHRLVQERLGLALCSATEEARDPAEADRRICDAFDRIRHEVWGKRDLPSHAANVDYGFARNLYGCRWLWWGLSAGGLAAGVIVPVVTESPFPTAGIAACTLLAIVVPLVEWRLVRSHARHCAERYAEHAWEHLEHMEHGQATR